MESGSDIAAVTAPIQADPLAARRALTEDASRRATEFVDKVQALAGEFGVPNFVIAAHVPFAPGAFGGGALHTAAAGDPYTKAILAARIHGWLAAPVLEELRKTADGNLDLPPSLPAPAARP
jgi:hypothetical protein